ncbi:MAG: 4'-phosphopantetheinyl transferase superfamily protein [Gemmatimonadetes bacterium]|nr:4'-phosphopantetheinyl transferase superfamily protein [Gemmatimonadota bacterium]NNK62193.1 4'-phosphopantetheinyl transferase superfamily protein [Gemmatimonadota bacterium]
MSEPGPLPPTACVGIDVVDRRSPRVLPGLPRNRTVRRVLDEREFASLAAAPDPALRFWTYWAAKEAAFKAVTLRRGAPPVFAHAAFSVDLDDQVVRYGEHTLRLSVHRTDERLVAVARTGEHPDGLVWAAGRIDVVHDGLGGGSLKNLLARFTAAERDAVHRLESAIARLAVRREAAIVLATDQASVEVICPAGPAGRRPLYLHRDGRLVDEVGLSISHDGGWVAWAVASGGPTGQRAGRTRPREGMG